MVTMPQSLNGSRTRTGEEEQEATRSEGGPVLRLF